MPRTELELPASVTRVEGPIERFDVATPLATAELYRQGAHVARWRPAHADAPVLFVSRESAFAPGRPIRGGVPICFPWFGPHPADPAAPAHGFARTADWALVAADEAADGSVSLALVLEADAGRVPAWPHAFRITHHVTIGSRLTMALTVENRGSEPFAFEAALHTYLAVADVQRVTVAGLDGTVYLDKVRGFARTVQDGPLIRFSGETDRIYLDTAAACTVDDPGLGRRTRVSKSGSQTTVVWNPWIDRARALPDLGDGEWREMVCVETANAGSAAIRLAPGGAHRMSAEISVAAS